ncbi:MAG: serine/threonine protein kinase [Planctomycetota bacterium]|nr:MAG: serine/threonine protein kinase [Planctomycetota bacterium]
MAFTFKHGDRPIEGYTIQRAVGKGGFGEVYYAISDGGREVAIKYLRDNPQVELRGVSNCINLKSPHLVSIFDVKKTVDGEYAIIMEYCSGPSLRDLLIAEPKGFAPEKAAFFVREIGKGLSYLHDRGIVHRDLKPGNIFYDDGYVKIGDYGLSKFISVSRHSGQTASVGTVHYMAPEIGSGHYSKGVDIYALGVILYEMLLGRVPFEGSSMAEVLMKHLTAQPELDCLPEPFGDVIRKALEKDPKDRYQSVDEMVGDLLEVETVRRSLAGFSTKSLEGAVRRGTPERLESPIPSPNPAGDWGQLGVDEPPFAQPLNASPRLQRKMERVSRKLERKLARLEGRPVRARPRRAETDERTIPVSAPPALSAEDRRKRMALTGLLSVGLAIGLAVLVGGNMGAEEGVATGMLVLGMSAGLVLAHKATRWFGVTAGPGWARKMVRMGCCMPLLAVGVAPVFGERGPGAGSALFLAMTVICTLTNWNRVSLEAAGGELRLGRAIGTAFWGMIVTVILAGMFDAGREEDLMLIGAAVTGVVSLIVQAAAWWMPVRERGRTASENGGLRPPPPPPRLQTQAPATGEEGGRAETTGSRADVEAAPVDRVPRWGLTRAFWGLVSFGLLAGAIATFVIALVERSMSHHDKTGVIVGCIACTALLLFTLRKTSPTRRVGFWRETVRPFLLSAMLFGIGATTTAIAREWSHRVEGGFCLTDEQRAGLVTGLVLCSLGFGVVALLRGRRSEPSRPFVLPTEGKEAEELAPGVAAAPDRAEAVREGGGHA